MRLMKVNLMAADAFVPGNDVYINIDQITAITATGATCLVNYGHDGVMTVTVDGGDAAIKLANAAKFGTWLTTLLVGQGGADDIILDIFAGMTVADLETATGIVSPGTNDGVVSITVA